MPARFKRGDAIVVEFDQIRIAAVGGHRGDVVGQDFVDPHLARRLGIDLPDGRQRGFTFGLPVTHDIAADDGDLVARPR